MSDENIPAPLTVEQLEEALKGIENEDRTPGILDEKTANNPLLLREFVDADQLRRDVSFELHNLDNAIRQQAGLYVHYADLARRARRQHDKMKTTAEVMEAKLYSVHRQAFINQGIAKPTKDQIDAAVKMDPRWFAAQQKVIDARAIMDLAVESREALSQRKDMLVQVSVDRRREREGEMRVGAAPQDPRHPMNQDTREGVLAHLRQQRQQGGR
jgi:hypothetical protein